MCVLSSERHTARREPISFAERKAVKAAPPNLYFPSPPSKPIRFDVDDDVVDWAGPAHTIARVISFNLGPKGSLVLALDIPRYPCL